MQKNWMEEQYEEWKQYHEDKRMRERMQPILQTAWNEAEEKGIDPDMEKLPKVSGKIKQQMKENTKQMFVYAQSISTMAIQRATENKEDYCLLLFDVEKVLIKIYGNDKMLRWLSKRGIEEWTDWSEEKIGPNVCAMGFEGEDACRMSGSECYISNFLGVEWLFTPIIGSGKEVKGGLAILRGMNFRGVDENLLFSLRTSLEVNYFWFDALKDCFDTTDGMGLMAMDLSLQENRILVLSRQVPGMLRVNGEKDYFYQKAEKLIDPLPQNAEFWDILKKKKRVDDYAITLICHGRKTQICITTSPYKQENYHIDGMVVIFNAYKRIQRLISKYSAGAAVFTFDSVIGESPAFKEILSLCKNAAAYDGNILLMGESGSGKDVLAQAIHNESKRSGGPFVALNCAAFSKELIASELFGYVEGAFTGAKKGGSVGKLELANKGTLFLDEIGDMPIELQAVLLRVLEEKSFMKIGGNELIKVDVRIIAATNQNLMKKISENEFRSDLFYRLSVVRVKVPALRERKEDILLLSDYFIGNICARYGRRKMATTEEAEKCLMEYAWPGNVRELQNMLDGIICTCQGDVIEEKEVRQYIQNIVDLEQKDRTETTYVQDEKQQIIELMQKCRGNRTKAAKSMNMSRSTFYRRLKEFGLEDL